VTTRNVPLVDEDQIPGPVLTAVTVEVVRDALDSADPAWQVTELISLAVRAALAAAGNTALRLEQADSLGVPYTTVQVEQRVDARLIAVVVARDLLQLDPNHRVAHVADMTRDGVTRLVRDQLAGYGANGTATMLETWTLGGHDRVDVESCWRLALGVLSAHWPETIATPPAGPF
jgi:hypothetical protein